MARNLSNPMLTSPNQAATTFSLGGANPPRQKALFIVRFLQKNPSSDAPDGMSFLVKSIDRPTINLTTEELNQYNKKRLAHTGVKYAPVNCILYDTADSKAMSMLVQYAQYYLGDFRQDPSAFADDAVSGKLLGASNGISADGFGMGIASTTSSNLDGANSQFFFDRIEVFQVWGGEYTCFQLVNPRLNTIDPDALDYEDHSLSTISLSIDYEAVYFENAGKPQKITSNAALSEIFSLQFNGDVFDPEPSQTRATDFTSTAALSTDASSISKTFNVKSAAIEDVLRDVGKNDGNAQTTSSGGSLSQFGNFGFGDFMSLGSTLPSELSTLSGSQISNKITNSTTKSAAKLSDVSSAIGAASALEGNTPMDHITPRTNTSQANPFDFVMARIPMQDYEEGEMPQPAHTEGKVQMGQLKEDDGLSLSNTAIAIVNTRSDGTSQIGVRKPTSKNPLLRYIMEPKPAQSLTPPIVYGRANTDVPILIYGRIRHDPIPSVGTIARAIKIVSSTFAKVDPTGRLAATIRVTSNSRVINAASGRFNRPIQFRSDIFGVTTVRGTSNPLNGVSRPIAVKINSNGFGVGAASGRLNSRPVIRMFASGDVKTRASTLFSQVRINPTMRGRVAVMGSMTKPIRISHQGMIIFPAHGSLTKTLNISMNNGRATHIILRTGTMSKALNIKSVSTGTAITPRTASMNKPIVINRFMLASHAQPSRGLINKSIVVNSNALGFVIPRGTMNRAIKITPTARANMPNFGTMNKPIALNINARGRALVRGTINRAIVFNRNISGVSVTNVTPDHRYWRLRTTSSQSVVGPNEIQFRLSDGTPLLGSISASSSYNATYSADKAFDRDGSTWWSSAVGSAQNSWIRIDLGAGNAEEVHDVLIATDQASRVPLSYELQYSDDGTNWFTKATASIAAPEDNSIYVTSQISVEPLESQTTYYRGMYRFRAVDNAGDSVRIAHLALFNQNGDNIPAMSPFASSTAVGSAANAFDVDQSSVWVSSTAEASSATVGFYAASLDTTISSISLRADPSAGGGVCVPVGFDIEYSNDDGGSWSVVYSVRDAEPFNDGELRIITLDMAGFVDIGDGSALGINDDDDVLGF